MIVLLALQVLIPPAWVKHGLDCFQRCRLAAATGAHCPLMYGARTTKSQHHCQEHPSAPAHGEVRCHCSSSSPSASTLDVARFVLPRIVTVMDSRTAQPQVAEPVVLLVETFRTPPDPPPRLRAVCSS